MEGLHLQGFPKSCNWSKKHPVMEDQDKRWAAHVQITGIPRIYYFGEYKIMIYGTLNTSSLYSIYFTSISAAINSHWLQQSYLNMSFTTFWQGFSMHFVFKSHWILHIRWVTLACWALLRYSIFHKSSSVNTCPQERVSLLRQSASSCFPSTRFPTQLVLQKNP